MRTPTPPQIDARLDDAVWQLATPIGPLTQVEPGIGIPPSQPTEVRLLYDDAWLYIAVRCFDDDPSGIISTQRERDAVLDPDDRVEIYLDTFLDRRNAYFFQINPGGSKGDALITANGGNFNKPWNGIWEGEATIDEQGWCAELALPFKTLNFRAGLETWGFNIQRFIRRHREVARWSGARRDVRAFQISEAGDIAGFAGIRQGLGLDVVPFFVSRLELDNRKDDAHLLGQPGLDAFYKLGSNLTLSMTINTDFAETEVDERQINLTRFPLFFPERRDFFLQDAGLFEFGGGDRDALPFFSRRIGLVDGDEVPILTGLKLTGRIDDYQLGVLDVQTDEAGTLASENLFVGRVTKNVGELSSIGTIVTHGNPVDDGRNTVIGFDATYRTTSFRGDKRINSTAWFLLADSEDARSGEAAFGASLSYPNDTWSSSAGFKEIQENFAPALGFVPRAGVRLYEGALTYLPRIGGRVRQLEFAVETDVVTDLDNEIETVSTELQPFGVFWESGEGARIEVEQTREELSEDFAITDDVTIPAGDYDFTRARIEFESAEKRPLSVILNYTVGEFFDGDRQDLAAGVNWRPGTLYNASLSYSLNNVSLPDGDFETQLARGRLNFAFSPRTTWSNFVQWDSESDGIGVNSRLRWIPEPGREVFLVFNQTLQRDEGSLETLFQELAFKVGYTLRF